MAATETHANVMRNFVDNLQLVLSQIKNGETERDEKDNFDHNSYWTHLGAVFSVMSNEATKLSMMYSKPPVPSSKETEPMIASLEKATLTLVSAYYSFPKSQGLTLRKILKSAVLEIVESVSNLATNIADFSLGSQGQLQATGIIWHGANVISSLPKSNHQAVLVLVQETSDLVRDALHELQEAIDNEGEPDDLDEILMADGFILSNEDSWSDADKELLTACMGLIKTVRSLLKKTKEAVKQNGLSDTGSHIAQFDDLADHLGRLSPASDDLAASLYPAMVYLNIDKLADDLFLLVENFLQFFKHSHMTGEDDEQWLEFLLKANIHNRDKIHSLVNKS